MAFSILPFLSARDLDIGPEGFSLRDDINRGLMTREIWKRPCINLFIKYFAKTDNMLLPFTRGQNTCYFPRKMLLPRSQITRRKLCFYYTCKFGVISTNYVIIYIITRGGFEGACGVCICYTTLIKQFNKQLFHEWLTRDL